MLLIRKIWRWIKWPLFAFVVIFIGLIVWRMTVLSGVDDTKAAVSRIHASKLAWSDINGELPPAPDPKQNDATLAGVDSNNNGIRDDVERAIFTKYKSNQKTAVAMLQYAKALQKEFTDVFNSDTLVAVIQEQARGSLCIGDNDEQIDFVENAVFNNTDRKSYKEENSRKFMTSYTLPSAKGACDLSF